MQPKTFKNAFRKPFNPLEEPPRVISLKQHYARSETFERKRARFYAAIAREFGGQGWRFHQAPRVIKAKPGRDGKPQQVEKPTSRNAIKRDLRISVAEFLQFGKQLDDPTWVFRDERHQKSIGNRGEMRKNIARIIATDHEIMTCSDLSSPDWMKAGGGGGGGPAMIGSERLEAAGRWARLIEVVPVAQMMTIRKLLVEDQYLWEVEDDDESRVIMEEVRKALDLALLAYGHIGYESVLLRWPELDLTARARPNWIAPRLKEPSEERPS